MRGRPRRAETSLPLFLQHSSPAIPCGTSRGRFGGDRCRCGIRRCGTNSASRVQLPMQTAIPFDPCWLRRTGFAIPAALERLVMLLGYPAQQLFCPTTNSFFKKTSQPSKMFGRHPKPVEVLPQPKPAPTAACYWLRFGWWLQRLSLSLFRAPTVFHARVQRAS